MAAIQINSDNTVELRNFKDTVTGNAVTTATVTVTISRNGTPVAGATWPISMPHIANGLYRGNIPNDVELSDNKEYRALIVADNGVDQHWEKCIQLSAVC